MGKNARRRRGEKRAPEPKANGNGEQPDVVTVAIPLMQEAIALPADGGIRFNQTAAAASRELARVLILDLVTNTWRPVMLPAGMWVLQPEPAADTPAEPPKIWTP